MAAVSAALEEMQAARPALFSPQKEDGPTAPLAPPLHFGVAGPPPIVSAFPREGRDARAVLSIIP